MVLVAAADEDLMAVHPHAAVGYQDTRADGSLPPRAASTRYRRTSETPGSLLLRHEAGQWSTVYGPKADDTDPLLSASTNDVPGTSTFWGVGSSGRPSGGTQALIEQVTGD